MDDSPPLRQDATSFRATKSEEAYLGGSKLCKRFGVREMLTSFQILNELKDHSRIQDDCDIQKATDRYLLLQ